MPDNYFISSGGALAEEPLGAYRSNLNPERGNGDQEFARAAIAHTEHPPGARQAGANCDGKLTRHTQSPALSSQPLMSSQLLAFRCSCAPIEVASCLNAPTRRSETKLAVSTPPRAGPKCSWLPQIEPALQN